MTAASDRTAAAGRLRSFGRTQGHRLRKGRRALVDVLLPQLRVPLPAAGGRLDAAALFPFATADLWIEIGFGGGEHLAAQAAARADVGMIGCEPFVNGVAALLARIDAEGLANLRIHDGDARDLLDVLPDASVGRIFILFPDPWPKVRHHKRRIIAPATLDALARVLTDGGELRFASDDMGYVRWTLDHVTRHPAFAWTARRPADWRVRPADGVETRYEAKALRAGKACVYLRFRRRPRQESTP